MDRQQKRYRKPKVPLFDWKKFDPSMVRNDGLPSMVEEFTTYRDRLPELLQVAVHRMGLLFATHDTILLL